MAKTLKDYTDNELYAELERRGHYDCFEVCVDDVDDAIYRWAEENDLIDRLMSEWQSGVMDVLEYVEGIWDALDEAAKNLGYDPDKEYDEE